MTLVQPGMPTKLRPGGLRAEHLREPGNFVLRVAERALENWLLADTSLAGFLEASPALLPSKRDRETHPKQTLVNLVRRFRSRTIRNDLVPEKGSLGAVGEGYTPRLSKFIEHHWEPDQAQSRSEGLRAAPAAVRSALQGTF